MPWQMVEMEGRQAVFAALDGGWSLAFLRRPHQGEPAVWLSVVYSGGEGWALDPSRPPVLAVDGEEVLDAGRLLELELLARRAGEPPGGYYDAAGNRLQVRLWHGKWEQPGPVLAPLRTGKRLSLTVALRPSRVERVEADLAGLALALGTALDL